MSLWNSRNITPFSSKIITLPFPNSVSCVTCRLTTTRVHCRGEMACLNWIPISHTSQALVFKDLVNKSELKYGDTSNDFSELLVSLIRHKTLRVIKEFISYQRILWRVNWVGAPMAWFVTTLTSHRWASCLEDGTDSAEQRGRCHYRVVGRWRLSANQCCVETLTQESGLKYKFRNWLKH